MPRREWVVDSVPLQLLALTGRGKLVVRYFVRYAGFADSACGWEPRASMNAATIEEDVLTLEARLRAGDANELQQHRVMALRCVEREVVKVLKRREGASVLDQNVVALCRIEPLTFQRLFGERLELLVSRLERTGPPTRRTYLLRTTTSFYATVFPCTALRRLAPVLQSKSRRILAVTARVNDAHRLAGEIVFVMTERDVYVLRTNRVIAMTCDCYTIQTQITLRFSRHTDTSRNLRITGAVMQLKPRHWQVALRALPRW
jgi:hypothetical protein